MQTGPLPTTPRAEIILFTGSHTLRAEMPAGSRRLSDAVNDPLRQYLYLEQVQITYADRMDERVGAYDQATLRREVIHAILIMREPPQAREQRLANFVAKTALRVAVLLPAFLIEGTIQFAGKADGILKVLEGPETFAVISDASVTLRNRSSGPIPVPTAMVNRAHIELVTILP